MYCSSKGHMHKSQISVGCLTTNEFVLILVIPDPDSHRKMSQMSVYCNSSCPRKILVLKNPTHFVIFLLLIEMLSLFRKTCQQGNAGT